MATVTATTQCPNCMGPLTLNPETQLLTCDYCESSFTPEEIEAANAAKQEKAAEAFEKEKEKEAKAAAAEAAKATETDAGTEATAGSDPTPTAEPAPKKEAATYKQSKWDASTIDADWGEAANDICTYSCASCGGEIICESTTAATQCPYCGNQTVVPGQFSIGYRPTCIIPFKYTPDQAKAALRNHYRRKLFLPKEFTNKNQIDKLQGIYVPFWLFTGKCQADVRFDGTKSSEHREGDYIVTTTEHYDVDRQGSVPFDKVPTDASSKMPDSMMDSLEPFDYSELKPFSTAYLPGFLADKYDVDLDECGYRADKRCQSTTVDMLRRDVKGYDSVNVQNQTVNLMRDKVDYALLPVYVIKTHYDDDTYLFAMNGQTGKLVGDLPASKTKFYQFMGIVAAIIAILLFVLGISGGIADGIWDLLTY